MTNSVTRLSDLPTFGQLFGYILETKVHCFGPKLCNLLIKLLEWPKASTYLAHFVPLFGHTGRQMAPPSSSPKEIYELRLNGRREGGSRSNVSHNRLCVRLT